MKGCRR